MCLSSSGHACYGGLYFTLLLGRVGMTGKRSIIERAIALVGVIAVKPIVVGDDAMRHHVGFLHFTKEYVSNVSVDVRCRV